MRDLDEMDMAILTQLLADGRRPFSTIGEEVNLSGPAVSDRVSQLLDAGVINRFTVDIDRSQLRAGIPVFVQVAVSSENLDGLRDQLREADGVEHVFVTAGGDLWFFARAQRQNVRQWLDGLLAGVDTGAYSVTLIDEVAWQPSLGGAEFALTCAECSNTVDSEGVSTSLDGEMYHFCCSSCQTRFEERYDELAAGA